VNRFQESASKGRLPPKLAAPQNTDQQSEWGGLLSRQPASSRLVAYNCDRIDPMDSYARGPQFALTTNTASQTFLETAARFADREALIVPHQHIRLSWAQLADEVEKTARGLADSGSPPAAESASGRPIAPSGFISNSAARAPDSC